MKHRKAVIICSVAVIALLLATVIFLTLTGGPRSDVFLDSYTVSEDGDSITLNVGITSSAGHVRKLERTGGSTNGYYTFYSTFGINSRIGAKISFEINIDQNVDEIYFYSGDGGYRKVLEQDESGEWHMVRGDA